MAHTQKSKGGLQACTHLQHLQQENLCSPSCSHPKISRMSKDYVGSDNTPCIIEGKGSASMTRGGEAMLFGNTYLV